MIKLADKKGLIIFIGLLLLVVVMSLAAYGITGKMGIEERFTHAVGLVNMGDKENSGWFGLALEGNLLLYAVVLCILVVASYIVYRHFSI